MEVGNRRKIKMHAFHKGFTCLTRGMINGSEMIGLIGRRAPSILDNYKQLASFAITGINNVGIVCPVVNEN